MPVAAGLSWFWFLGSVVPDIDHLCVMVKNKIFNCKKFIGSIKNERKYGIRYKTPQVHSLLGLIIFSLIACLISKQGAMIFAAAYFLHLLMDWPDIDEKYYLYPFKIKFLGFLPIWSRFEQIITVILIFTIAGSYMIKIN